MKRVVVGLAALLLVAVGCKPTEEVEDPIIPDEPPVVESANTVAGKPAVVIDSPPSGSQMVVGGAVFVQSTSSDPVGVLRVVLQVDGVQISSDETPDPSGQPIFTLLQTWSPQTAGEHTITVTAYRADGTASDPATILLSVVATSAEVQATIAPAPITASIPPTTTSGPCTAYIKTDLNVRQGPGTSYQRVTTLAPGTQVDIVGKKADGSWWQVSYSGGGGWMSAGQQYSITSGDCSSVPVTDSGVSPPPATQSSSTQAATQGSPTQQPTQQTVEYAPIDNDQLFFTVMRDDGTVQFNDRISYPEGDTEDKIWFTIEDLNQGIGAQNRDVLFTLVCTGPGADNVRWGTGGGSVLGKKCGQSLSKFFTYDSDTVLITIRIDSGGYSLVNYTIVAIIS